MKFEMTIKTSRKQVVTTTDDIESLLGDMSCQIAKARLPMGRLYERPYSGARGEIEIGVEGGPQISVRVLD